MVLGIRPFPVPSQSLLSPAHTVASPSSQFAVGRDSLSLSTHRFGVNDTTTTDDDDNVIQIGNDFNNEVDPEEETRDDIDEDLEEDMSGIDSFGNEIDDDDDDE